MKKLLVAAIALVSIIIPLFSAEAEVLSKIKVTDKEGKVSYYDNFGSLIEDNVIFKEYKERPGVYYPAMKNPYNAEYEERIWVEFNVLPWHMESESFGKGSWWFIGRIYVPMQYVWEMKPFKLRFAVEVENNERALISIDDIKANVGEDEKMFLKFFDAISNKTPLRVAGWLYTARFTLALTKQELYRGYLKESVVSFEPKYAFSLWWNKESFDTPNNSRGLNIQTP